MAMKHSYKVHRELLAEKIKAIGIRQFAGRANVNPMLVSRFVNKQGGDDAWVIYQFARFLGYELKLVPSSLQVSHG